MSKSLTTATVLVIEDNENNLLVTQRLLELAQVGQIISYRSVSETLNSLTVSVDLVLLDTELEGENGMAMLPRLRQDGRFSTATIVALTANVLPSDVEKARQAGFDGFLGKPLSFERFPGQLRQLAAGESVWQMR